MTKQTSICVHYKNVDGWHVFTSDDVAGLYVASRDAELAYADVALSVKTLLSLNEGIQCEVAPELPVAEFIEQVRSAKRKPPRKYERPITLSSQRYAVAWSM